MACPTWELQPSPRSTTFSPWTHVPACSRSPATGNQLCVYTNANFHSGISLVAAPKVASRIISEGLLRKVPLPRGFKSKYESRHIQDKGMGLFVKDGEMIAAGETILVDYPTLILPSQLADPFSQETVQKLQWQAVLQLPDKARRRTRAVARSMNALMDEIENAMATNSFYSEKAGAQQDALFTEASRMNHGCLPNAFTRTSDTTFAMQVVALRPLNARDEILISYIDSSTELTVSERNAQLSAQWGFRCRCPICAGPGAAASDARRQEIANLKTQLYRSTGDDPVAILDLVTRMIQLYEAEGMITALGEHYEIAAYAAKSLGLDARTLRYAAEARKWFTIMYGEGSSQTRAVEAFVQDLGDHPPKL